MERLRILDEHQRKTFHAILGGTSNGVKHPPSDRVRVHEWEYLSTHTHTPLESKVEASNSKNVWNVSVFYSKALV